MSLAKEESRWGSGDREKGVTMGRVEMEAGTLTGGPVGRAAGEQRSAPLPAVAQSPWSPAGSSCPLTKVPHAEGT